jgi:hypothetical protein
MANGNIRKGTQAAVYSNLNAKNTLIVTKIVISSFIRSKT